MTLKLNKMSGLSIRIEVYLLSAKHSFGQSLGSTQLVSLSPLSLGCVWFLREGVTCLV